MPGLFDNLFSAFSTGPAEQAAQARINALQQAQAQAGQAIGQGQERLTQGYGLAQNYLAPISGLYSRLQGSADLRASAYDDATGVNGPEGLARARALFTATPGYQEGLTMGLDQLDRRAGARGMLGSGNTAADTLRYATDYANQGYGNYLSGLRPFVGQDLQTAAGQAGVGRSQAGLQQDLANQIFGGDIGRAGIGFQTGQAIGNAQADAAMAPYQASNNLWNALLGAGRLVAGAFGGGIR